MKKILSVIIILITLSLLLSLPVYADSSLKISDDYKYVYYQGEKYVKVDHLTREMDDLTEKSVDIFLPEWETHRHVHENYNSITGEGCDAHNSDKFYHWGALMSVIALMEADMAGDLDLAF